MSPRVRSVLLLGVIFLSTAAVIGNAYLQRQQFYPTVVYITKSNPSLAVMYLQIFVLVLLLGRVLRKVFFGSLRGAEFEHLMERSWYAVTETCLAFTVFKDDFSPKFVALFTVLLFLKSFHWILEDRVDYMERSPSISILFHIRVLSLSVILIFFDSIFIMHAYNSTLTKGASVQLVFGFEYAVLLTILANTLVKYCLHSADLSSENPWDNKAVFMLYTELAIGFIKVLLYVLFVVIMVRIYTLPLFAVRPMYLTMRAFKKAFNDVILSRRAIYNMNTWYPDATQEELNNTDNVCIICREEMLAPTTKKLPCNHIFHKPCLRSWFQRQQTCPTCRLDVLQVPQASNQHRAQHPLPPQQPNPPQPPQAPQQQPILGFPFHGIDPNVFAQLGQVNRPPNVVPPNLGGLPQVQRNLGAQPNSAANQSQTPTASNNVQRDPPLNNPAFPFGPMPPFGAAATAPGSASASSNQPPNMPNLLPGFSTPPLFLPFLPPPTFFAMPPAPPQPPANFSGLSREELQLMEGEERQNVEARIKVLRNIQTLLDAAVFEMQQYSAVASRINIQPSASTSSAEFGPEDPSSQKRTTSDSSTSVPTEVPTKTHCETGTRPKTFAQRQTHEEELINKMDDKENENGTSAEYQELRRRRLEKFDQS